MNPISITTRVKGGVIQVHPFASEESIAIDYFGDQIENIKITKKDSSLSSITIVPYPLRNKEAVLIGG